MPTYEYLCSRGHRTEVRQSMSDEPLDVCTIDGCGADARRKISAGGGVLTGKRSGGSPREAPASGGACCGPAACACRN